MHIKVDDIDAALHQIANVGGRPIMPKTRKVPDSDEPGFLALVADNVGNRIGLST